MQGNNGILGTMMQRIRLAECRNWSRAPEIWPNFVNAREIECWYQVRSALQEWGRGEGGQQALAQLLLPLPAAHPSLLLHPCPHPSMHKSSECVWLSNFNAIKLTMFYVSWHYKHSLNTIDSTLTNLHSFQDYILDFVIHFIEFHSDN